MKKVIKNEVKPDKIRNVLFHIFMKYEEFFPVEERIRYKLVSYEETIIDSKLFEDSKELKILKNEQVGGIKLVYKVCTQYPRLLLKSIPWLPKNTTSHLEVYWRPLKIHWNISQRTKLPYAIAGRPTSPFLGMFVRINKDFKDFNKESRGIKHIDFIKTHSNKLNTFLINRTKTFYLQKN